MKTLYLSLFCYGYFFSYPIHAQITEKPPQETSSSSIPTNQQDVEQIVLFTPPKNWYLAEPPKEFPHVKVLVQAKTNSITPPRMNLSIEPWNGTLKQYLKIVKEKNDKQGYEWKDLGTIRTEAGPASLSQVDTKTPTGDLRLMHVILLKDGKIYILTASATVKDFPLFYKDFFASMRSLRVAKDVFELVTDPQQRSQLKTAANKVQTQWKTLVIEAKTQHPEWDDQQIKENIFKSDQFQNNTWKPFEDMIRQKYSGQGAEWQSIFLNKMENDLFNTDQQ